MATPNLGRRAFLRGRSPRYNKTAIRPPWSRSIDSFIEHCTRCDDCAEACPENIIIKGDGGYPEVDFSRGECTFCKQCVEGCTADAFSTKNNTINSAWALQAKVLSTCLSINKVTCRSCGDHCDAGAIRFQLKVGGVAIPIIENEHCTGCGACVYVCPSKSITLTA
ncbi:MAG: ferredoxin-type protein NapF [Cocleimonas sp.]|nr:ferredoxin-type protein NapF [Cocleimonas sp.]